MALPNLTRTTDRVRLISIGDPSIDADKTPAQALNDYAACEALDVGALVLTDEPPTFFELRPLSEYEIALCAELGRENNVALSYTTARLGLVSVENWEGFEVSRAMFSGVEALSLECVQQIPWATVQWLALVIWRLSRLDERQKKASTSSRRKAARKAGMTKGSTTARSAKSIQPCAAS